MENIKICCPKCEWEPDGKPYWQCSCGHKWDTFSTGGRCPECKRVWEDTQCIACHKWSPHLDWYSGLEDVVQKLLEAIKKQWAIDPIYTGSYDYLHRNSNQHGNNVNESSS